MKLLLANFHKYEINKTLVLDFGSYEYLNFRLFSRESEYSDTRGILSSQVSNTKHKVTQKETLWFTKHCLRKTNSSVPTLLLFQSII